MRNIKSPNHVVVRPDEVSEEIGTTVKLINPLGARTAEYERYAWSGTVVAAPMNGFILKRRTTKNPLSWHLNPTKDPMGNWVVDVPCPENVKEGDRVVFHPNLANRLEKMGKLVEVDGVKLLFISPEDILYVVGNPPRPMGETIMCEEIPANIEERGGLILDLNPGVEANRAIVRHLGFDWDNSLFGIEPGMTVSHNLKKNIPLRMVGGETNWCRLAPRNILCAIDPGVTDEEIMRRRNLKKDIEDSINNAMRSIGGYV